MNARRGAPLQFVPEVCTSRLSIRNTSPAFAATSMSSALGTSAGSMSPPLMYGYRERWLPGTTRSGPRPAASSRKTAQVMAVSGYPCSPLYQPASVCSRKLSSYPAGKSSIPAAVSSGVRGSACL